MSNPDERSQVILSTASRKKATSIARFIANKLIDADNPERLDALLAAWNTGERSPAPRSVPFGLAFGNTGLAVLFSTLNDVVPNEGWEIATDKHLRANASVPNEVPLNLYGGLAGILYGASTVFGGDRYLGFRQQLVSELERRILSEWPLPYTPPQYTSDFELIQGAAGVAIALVQDKDGTSERASSHSRALARLSDFMQWMISDHEQHRWRVGVRFASGEIRQPTHNLGIAHGICGVLATLAILNVPSSEVIDAANSLADWIVEKAQPGICWPAAFDNDRLIGSRQGWCYGTPSVALTIRNLGTWLGRSDLIELSARALINLSRADPTTWTPAEHTVCHGTMGLALIAEDVGLASGSQELVVFASRLYLRVIDAFDAELPLGYYSFGTDARRASSFSLLEGAAGIALALASLNSDRCPTWKRMFGFMVTDS